MDMLDGIRIKRSRAWSQINTLKRKFAAFIESDPYVPLVQFDRQPQQLIMRAEIRREADPMWGVEIGEIIHNLRCCLDYLAHELFIRSNGKPPPAGSKIQFPIFKSVEGFEGSGVRILNGISNTAIAMIRADQPFTPDHGGTGEGIQSPLWHLRELSNTDKHRTIQLTGAMVQEFEFSFPKVFRTFRQKVLKRAEVGPIQNNAILCHVRLYGAEEWPFSEGDINCTLAIDVVFQQGSPEPLSAQPVYSTLVGIANRTDRVLRQFFEDTWNAEL